MVLHDLNKHEKIEVSSKNPDIAYLQIIWLSSDEIKKATNINVLDIIEEDAIIRNQEHFIWNMLQMIDNWNVNEKLWIWEWKYNKKVRNFISKSDWELLKLWITPENIIQIRIKTWKRNYISNLLELIEINPYEIENNLIINYLLSIPDYIQIDFWLEMTDLNLLEWAFKRAKNEINNK